MISTYWCTRRHNPQNNIVIFMFTAVRNPNLTRNKYHRQFPTSQHAWIPILDSREGGINKRKNRSCSWNTDTRLFPMHIRLGLHCQVCTVCARMFYLRAVWQYKQACPFDPRQRSANDKARHRTWLSAHNPTTDVALDTVWNNLP
jgi:hypothetical protein